MQLENENCMFIFTEKMRIHFIINARVRKAFFNQLMTVSIVTQILINKSKRVNKAVMYK